MYFTKNTMDLRVWVFENVPYKYFRLENWLHLDHPEKDNWLILSKDIGILVGVVPEGREHEAVSADVFKRRVLGILEA
jgi:hypothetical protein